MRFIVAFELEKLRQGEKIDFRQDDTGYTRFDYNTEAFSDNFYGDLTDLIAYASRDDEFGEISEDLWVVKSRAVGANTAYREFGEVYDLDYICEKDDLNEMVEYLYKDIEQFSKGASYLHVVTLWEYRVSYSGWEYPETEIEVEYLGIPNLYTFLEKDFLHG